MALFIPKKKNRFDHNKYLFDAYNVHIWCLFQKIYLYIKINC